MAPLNRFHVAVLVFWQFTILFATQMLFGIFTTYTPRWRCTSPGGNGDQNSSSPMSSRESAIVVAEEEADETEFGKDCAVYTQCPRLWLQFEQSPFASAAVDFDWICGPGAFNRALYSQIQFGGVLLGTFLMAPLSDRLGRKPVGLATLSLGILALALSSLSPTGLILLLARFLISLLMGGTLVVIATFTMELIPPEHRMILRTFCNWGTSRLIITFICFIFPNWRSASIAAALATTPALIILIFVLPESPIWLHSQGKMDKMRRSEQRIARFAGVPYVPVEYAPQSSKRANFLSLLRDRNLLCRLLVLWTMWFTSALSSYSIDLNSSNLSGDLFLNQLLLSFPIMLSKMFLFLLDSNWPGFSRRTLHQYSQAIVCLCFVLLTSVVLLDYDAPWLVLVLNQLGSAFIQYGWDACYVCALESMPTSVRSSSLGSCSLMSQFGAALAPLGIWILLVNLIGVTFLEFTWDANVLSTVESMPTQLRASSLGSCSMMARVGGSIAPLLVLLNDRWAASAYLAVAVVGSVNLVVSYCWLIDTKGIPLDAVGLVKEGTEKGNICNKSKLAVLETETFLPPPPIESC